VVTSAPNGRLDGIRRGRVIQRVHVDDRRPMVDHTIGNVELLHVEIQEDVCLYGPPAEVIQVLSDALTECQARLDAGNPVVLGVRC
jgi:hypothetical protein